MRSLIASTSLRRGESRSARKGATLEKSAIMAGGLAVINEPGTDPFAKRFDDAGFA